MADVWVKSRIPRIISQLAVRERLVERTVGERIEARAKDRVPAESGKLRDAIHLESDEDGTYVVAGNGDVFYGHFVELGTVRTAAQPFLVPAVEETRAEVPAIGKAALRSL